MSESFVTFELDMHENEDIITISLIIPVYNVSRYIERCLKSVIKQTYNIFECILVDDASPDDSIAICERIIAAYDGPITFRILHHEHNRGLSAARNTGIDAATGDYILFIDSDDIISNDCVEKLMAPVLNNKNIEMVIGEHLHFSNNGLLDQHKSNWRCKEDLSSHDAVRDLYLTIDRRLPPAAWNKLTSRDFINRHQLRFKEGMIWEDTLWTFFEMKYLSHVYTIPDVTYFYYNHHDSICKGTPQNVLSTHGCLVCDIISTNFTPGEENREAAKHLERFLYNYFGIPQSKRFQDTARRFAKALPFRKYPHERILLWAAMWLPHNETGRNIFKWLQKKNKRPHA